jgi:hypothetical protein
LRKAFAVEPPGLAIDLGARRAPVVARVNRRARRLIVRVDTVAGVVRLTAPSRRAIPEALRFAQSQADWIARQFEHGATARPFAPGGSCPYRGVPHRITLDGPPRMRVRRLDDPEPALLVGGDASHVNRRLVDWLKREAARDIAARVDVHARALGKHVQRISIRDLRSRWGSCSAEGALSFSWRLILAPPAMLDAVAAHECAHLVHLDHSPAFWRTVRSLGVDVEAARDWFRRHGDGLRGWGTALGSLSN